METVVGQCRWGDLGHHHCHVGDRGGGPLPSAGTTLTLTVTTLLVFWLARAFLLLAMMGLLDHGVAVSLALANGVSQLFVWGTHRAATAVVMARALHVLT